MFLQLLLHFLLDSIEVLSAQQYLVIDDWLFVGSLPELEEGLLVGHAEFISLKALLSQILYLRILYLYVFKVHVVDLLLQIHLVWHTETVEQLRVAGEIGWWLWIEDGIFLWSQRYNLVEFAVSGCFKLKRIDTLQHYPLRFNSEIHGQVVYVDVVGSVV